jgi:2-desacetyl-2-hydroxyethyl bacteriochlorophyllide A dehydrogenase
VNLCVLKKEDLKARCAENHKKSPFIPVVWRAARGETSDMSSASTPRRGLRLVFTGQHQVELQDFSLPLLDAGQVLVRIENSLMSIGTENIVFNRLFDPGTHWDNWVKYPFFPGYSAVGTVVESRGVTLKEGDRVAVRCGHQSFAVADETSCGRIPEDVSFDHAHWFALAKIAFHGALAAEFRLGDSVLVIGAGPIGQMSVRWARAAGAAVIVCVDTAVERLAMARSGGASAVVARPVGEAREEILTATGGDRPRVVIDSTGHPGVFASALSLSARLGRVVLLGDTGRPAAQQLTSDVITRGLTIIGAHDGLETPQWHNASITRYFFDLVASGRFFLQGLNTHFFAPSDCVRAYETANRDRSRTMGIVFRWGREDA